MPRPIRPAWLRRLARPLRLVARALLGLLAAVVAAVVVVLLLPATRRALLDEGLELAAGALPGELRVARADWPRLGSLALDGVVWTDGSDTLAAADTLRLDLDLGDALGRELTVRRVLVAGVRADVPAILALMPAPAETAAAAPPDSAAAAPLPLPWFREGAVAPLPALALERLAVRRVAIAVPGGRTVRLDSLTAVADLRRRETARLALQLRAWPLPGVGVAWRLDGGLAADSLAVAIAPVTIAVDGPLPDPASLPTPGRLAAPLGWLRGLASGGDRWPRLVLDDLEIQGAAGAWRLDARLAGREPGEIRLASELPAPPLPLLAAAGGGGLIPVAVADSLSARWREGGAPGLTFTLDLQPPAAGDDPLAGRYAAAGGLRLPPPAAFGPLLPPALQVSDLGPMEARLAAEFDGRAAPARWSADLDLGSTRWLDAGLIRGHGALADGEPTSATLDTLAFALPGLSLTGSGRATADSVAARLALVVPDSTLLQRWRDPRLAGLGLDLAAHVTVRGGLPLPRIEAMAGGAVRGPLVTIPSLDLAATAGPDTLDLRLALPQGLRSGARTVDSLAVAFAGAAGDSLRRLRGDLRAGVRLPHVAVDLAGRIRATDLLGAPAGTLTTDTLVIALGEQRLRNRGPWTLTLAAAESLLAIGDLDLAGELGDLQLAAEASPDSVAADLDLALGVARDVLASLLPPELVPLLPRASLTARGDVRAEGSLTAPWARADLSVGFADNADLESLRVTSRVHVGGEGPIPPAFDPDDPAWSPAGVRAQLALVDADTVLLDIAALAPLPHLGAGADSLAIAVRADRADLARLQPLLPAGVSLQGRLDADVTIRGEMEPRQTRPDLALGGGLALRKVRAGGPDGSWVALGGEVRLDGSSRAPQIGGGLVIEGGLIRLPEPPPLLLPASGEAMLWGARPAAADTVRGAAAAVAAATDTADARPSLPPVVPDLEFAVHAPGGLWLRGQGLDVELAGDLVLHLHEGVPGVEGRLEAVQGTMRQLGHVFRLERGMITFYRDEPEPDPHLDLQLGVTVQDHRVTITIGGQATDPRLAFGSEPPLGDGDIMSLLLFGKTADELDEGQAGLLADRAGEIALAYGATRLQEAVARRTGLDVVQIGPSEGGADATSLTVGKYLSPRVLVRYEQILDEQSGFYVHLDYRISGPLKLHTQVSQGQASGAEFAWEKDF